MPITREAAIRVGGPEAAIWRAPAASGPRSWTESRSRRRDRTLTSTTCQPFDAGTPARMKDDALLVNLSRGAVVNTDTLVKETQEGRPRAALDVTDP